MLESIENTENQDDAMIATYVLEALPFVYWGELYYDVEDKEQRKIILKRPLLQMINPKDDTSKFVRVPTTGSNSVVVLDTFTIRGILVKNPDPEKIALYKDNYIRHFSKLHLL